MTSEPPPLLQLRLLSISRREDQTVVAFADEHGRVHEAVAAVNEKAGIRGANLEPNLFAVWNGDADSLRAVVSAIAHFESAVDRSNPPAHRSASASRLPRHDSEVATEVGWDHVGLEELPGGRLYVDSVPFSGFVVDVQDGELISRARYSDGRPDGVSRDYVNGNCVREEWYRNGGLEGPALRFDDAGAIVRAEYYARGVLIVAHELTDGEWYETQRIEPGSTHAELSRLTWSG